MKRNLNNLSTLSCFKIPKKKKRKKNGKMFPKGNKTQICMQRKRKKISRSHTPLSLEKKIPLTTQQ